MDKFTLKDGSNWVVIKNVLGHEIIAYDILNPEKLKYFKMSEIVSDFM
jgi:hypothetical protein